MQKFKIGKQQVDLDPENLAFNEVTLTQYLQKEGGYYNNFGGSLATAEFLLARRESEYDALRGQKFKEYKDAGGSDKYADARTDSDQEVLDARERVAAAKFKVRLLQQHLRSWDKNHENAQSLGHHLRKEIDKLNAEIYGKGGFRDVDQEFKVDQSVGHYDKDAMGG